MIDKHKPGLSISPERPMPLNNVEADKRRSVDPASVLAIDKTPEKAAAKYNSEVKQNSLVQVSRNQRLEPITIEKPGPVNITKINASDNTEKNAVTSFQGNGPV